MSNDKESVEEAERLRDQEEQEEREYLRDTRGADSKPAIGGPIVKHTAKVVRDWVRSVLVPDAVKRMYDIGMGIETFATPTPLGNIVNIEAPPAVQQKALATLIGIGIPTQMGVTDDMGNALPGVFALGALDLDAARMQAHGDRYVAPEAHARAAATLQAGLEQAADAAAAAIPTGPTNVPPLRPMAERIAAGEFQVVEVIEGTEDMARAHGDQPPGPIAEVETPEKAALRAHKARMANRRGVAHG